MELNGKVLYSTPGWISNPRFSPDGSKIAFVNHQSRAGDPGRISVINVNDGKVTDLATDFVSTYGLAWPASGKARYHWSMSRAQAWAWGRYCWQWGQVR